MQVTTGQVDALNRVGRALADPTRCRILVALLDGPIYPARLAETLGLTRSNVSNHLTCLRGCGLVTATPQGRQVRYELADRTLAHAITDLLDVVLAVDPAHEDLGHTPEQPPVPVTPDPVPGDPVPADPVSLGPARRPGLAHERVATARPHDQ